ncbi:MULTISPECIES: CheB methylesterase domain-containing protein [unclassified Campylobacter]|uniref:CheB methylesterase domain-containing protein n=1 Tax=unclassified Campylobacter TaxID=2593542 RepID=UPI001237C4D7|nr:MULTISPECIES: chemotaxis protein CheB [unclassified Campylobacter]KAA6228416.1 chemotaxis protein CheB [Campylobacter sp. LR185c]KAA6228902.1 chemotaxis protein CheB [Campylobacter sp. LR196d]KAA6229389.1 chemotaxis protein CheB [Campylobacter sp. LR286c]KAA6229855.1 chemotaxis protein CheB [Campylobacter sp. LR264d]KAA8603734.1 chemotaxis protein CheB [Campylobacter sp. LR185c]
MKIILIGSSTGGPNQLKFLLKDIDIGNTCVIIAQHMKPDFIPSFVNQFDKEALNEVALLNDKEILENRIYICQTNTILSGSLTLSASFSDTKTNFKPNINLLFNSAVHYASAHKLLAILLTGMGDDGAHGLLNLYNAKVKCLCENEADCVVYGMPKRAKDLNPKLMPMSLKELKREILHFVESE